MSVVRRPVFRAEGLPQCSRLREPGDMSLPVAPLINWLSIHGRHRDLAADSLEIFRRNCLDKPGLRLEFHEKFVVEGDSRYHPSIA